MKKKTCDFKKNIKKKLLIKKFLKVLKKKLIFYN